MKDPWNNKGMTSYPENHINKSSIGFLKKKPDNWLNKIINFFKKSENLIIKKKLKTLRNET